MALPVTGKPWRTVSPKKYRGMEDESSTQHPDWTACWTKRTTIKDIEGKRCKGMETDKSTQHPEPFFQHERWHHTSSCHSIRMRAAPGVSKKRLEIS